MNNKKLTSGEGSELPEYYADRAKIVTGLFGVAFEFGLSDLDEHEEGKLPAQTRPVVVVRTSMTHAKAFAMILHKQVKAFEEKSGSTVYLPPDALKALGIEDIPW